MGPWRYFYCVLPGDKCGDVPHNGIRPRRMLGSDVIQLFPARRQVDRLLKPGQALFRIDAEVLDPKLFSKLDYLHIFYRGIIPPGAVTFLKNGGKNGGSKWRPRL